MGYKSTNYKVLFEHKRNLTRTYPPVGVVFLRLNYSIFFYLEQRIEMAQKRVLVIGSGPSGIFTCGALGDQFGRVLPVYEAF